MWYVFITLMITRAHTLRRLETCDTSTQILGADLETCITCIKAVSSSGNSCEPNDCDTATQIIA